MLHLWLGCVPLQDTSEDDNIQAGVREMSNSSEQRHAQLVQLRAAQIFSFRMLRLSVDNRPKAADEYNLIEGDLLGLLVLDVADSTIRENMPLDLEFAKDFLHFSEDFPDDAENSRELQIVDVLRHDCGHATFVMSHAELIVNLTGSNFAFVGDLS